MFGYVAAFLLVSLENKLVPSKTGGVPSRSPKPGGVFAQRLVALHVPRGELDAGHRRPRPVHRDERDPAGPEVGRGCQMICQWVNGCCALLRFVFWVCPFQVGLRGHPPLLSFFCGPCLRWGHVPS